MDVASRWMQRPLYEDPDLVCSETEGTETVRETGQGGQGVQRPSRLGSGVPPLPRP